MKRRKFLGLTWLGWLNFVIIQWFFIRIGEYVTIDIETKDNITTDNTFCIIYFVLPLTGWWSDYFPKTNNFWPK